jgi:uncharacterized protein
MLSQQCIYIHGFNSSGNAPKSCQLKQALQAFPVDYHSPDLPHQAQLALTALESLIDDERPVTFVGSSLGGFYATYLAHRHPNAKAVLINPALSPWQLLKDEHTEYQNPFTGEKFSIGKEELEQIKQFSIETIHNPQRFLLLLQADDEVVNYQEALAKFPRSPSVVRQGGGHLFADFEQIIPTIIEFIQG